jgi:hypothetical protein
MKYLSFPNFYYFICKISRTYPGLQTLFSFFLNLSGKMSTQQDGMIKWSLKQFLTERLYSHIIEAYKFLIFRMIVLIGLKKIMFLFISFD